MKALLLLDQKEKSDLVIFAIETMTGRKVETSFNHITSADALIKTAKNNPPLTDTHITSFFDLVIVEYTGTSTETLELLMQQLPFIKTIILVSEPLLLCSIYPPILALIDASKLPFALTDTLQTLLVKGDITKLTSDLYTKFPTHLLLENPLLKGDLYIQLNPEKYIKLFKEGDTFTRDDWKKYTEKKNIQYLFIKRSETKHFLENYISQLTDLSEASESPSLEVTTDLLTTSIQTLQSEDILKNFHSEAQQIIKTQVNLTLRLVQTNPRLNQILKNIINADRGYIANHSVMVSYVACGIANQMEWNAESTAQKLILASFLHDLLFSDNELAACNTIKDLNPEKFTVDQIAEFKRHPLTNAYLARNFSEIPPDVDTIILQHHEIPDGSGFPHQITAANIAPLSSIFIVAHDIVTEHLKNFTLKKNFNMKTFIKNREQLYSNHQFKKIFSILPNL